MSGAEARLLGRWGEAQAAEWLRKRGYMILAAGYRCRFGEIDLIAKDRHYICFVEVKLRKNAAFAPGRTAVNQGKQRRIRLTAEYYLLEHPEHTLQPRFDVVEVYAADGLATVRPKIQLWENAFY